MSTTSPGNAADVQALIQDRLNALSSSLEAQQTATIEWRGRQTYVRVIDMPVQVLSYNPDTHRVRAQRTLDPAREELLESDPYSNAAQGYLHYLLRGSPQDPAQEDPTFTALKESLAEHGQEEPGIITQSGVLVNGNTRCAALKELNRPHIRVGVLPLDAGEDDIRTIELSLQLRKEHKRDYSFVNFLLALDERVAAGRPRQEILGAFRIRQSTLDRSLWILELIREAIERSQRNGAGGRTTGLRLVDFESHQGKLEELYRAYITLKSNNPEDAEALREQRLLALVLDKSKTDLRFIEPNFAVTYMPTTIPDVDPVTSAQRTIPGTSIPASVPSQGIQQLRRMTDQALQAKGVVVGGGQEVAPTAAAAASQKIQELTSAVDNALSKAGKNALLRKRQVAPAERITDAVEDLSLAVEAIAEARAGARFETDDVEDALVSLRKAVQKLAQQVNLSADDSRGDGVQWLLQAAFDGSGD